MLFEDKESYVLCFGDLGEDLYELDRTKHVWERYQTVYTAGESGEVGRWEDPCFWSNKVLLAGEYTQIALFTVLVWFLATLIVTASYSLANQKPGTEKFSAYECGFEPYGDTKGGFEVQFYTTGLLFVLFDIEIIVLMPWCLTLASLDLVSYWSVIEFLLELGLGLGYALCGGLDWRSAARR